MSYIFLNSLTYAYLILTIMMRYWQTMAWPSYKTRTAEFHCKGAILGDREHSISSGAIPSASSTLHQWLKLGDVLWSSRVLYSCVSCQPGISHPLQHMRGAPCWNTPTKNLKKISNVSNYLMWEQRNVHHYLGQISCFNSACVDKHEILADIERTNSPSTREKWTW